jgi:hypothetical protein
MRRLLPVLFCLAACTPKTSSSSGGTQELPGTQARFDLDADVATPRNFYNLPWPSDLRLTSDGRPDLTGFPMSPDTTLVAGLVSTAQLRKAYPQMAVGYFEFTAPPSAQALGQVIPAAATSSVLLVDVDATSPQRGHLFPTVAHTPPTDDYVPANFLAVAGRPGMVLRPATTYAFVVMRSLKDAQGQPLGVPQPLEQLKKGETPPGSRGAAAKALYAPLWETLNTLGVPLADVAAATVFTTGNTVADLADLTNRVKEQYSVQITGLQLQPDWGTRDERLCSLVGTVRQPQFQKGTQPFNTEGLFEMGADGLPIKQGEMDTQVVITVPRTVMPSSGFPLVLYIHGSGGTSDQAVNAGPSLVAGGPSVDGQGPAYTVANFGIATACSAMPVNPERLPGATDYAYINLANPSAMRDVFRQGVIEQRLLLEALRTLHIPAASLTGCTGASLPAGAADYHFDDGKLVAMGQSMGGWYTNMLSSVEPRIGLAVPTGAGGFLSFFVLQTKIIDNVAGFLSLAVATLEPLTFTHPSMHMLDTACEAADPMVHVPRIARSPLPGFNARSIYEPVAPEDVYFDTTVYDAMALAYGNRQAGSQVWPTMQAALELDGRAGLLPYPVSGNLTSENGQVYTGAVVQHAPTWTGAGHSIYRQLPEVRNQIGCFVDGWMRTGTATVQAPRMPETACD